LSFILEAMEATASEMQSANPNVHYSARQRSVLFVLETITGISSVIGGIGLITGWLDVSKSHLEQTPFNSYVIPGLILLLAVGGLLVAAAWMVKSNGKYALEASLAAGFMLLGWFSVQIIMIGLFSWLQPILGGAGVAIAVIAVAASRR